jgi:ABC-type transport system substrate-binding protein
VGVTAAVLVSALAGCSADSSSNATPTPTPTAQRGGTLSLAVPVSPATTGWDPVVADPATQRVVGPAVMATLLRPDPQGGPPTPWLAEAAASDAAARVWTITLRQGLAFSDGQPLTAQDVVFALEQAAADPTLSTRFGVDANGTWFTSAVAQDPSTVVVTLRRGNGALDRLVLAAPEFGCIKVGYNGLTREDYFAAPPACGPFAISTPTDDSANTVALVRNDRYFAADEVLLDGITIDSGLVAQRTADLALDTSRGQPRPTNRATPLTPDTANDAPASAIPTSAAPPSTEPAPDTTEPTPDTTETTAPPVTPAAERWDRDDIALSPLGITTGLALRNAAPTSDANLRQAMRACIDYAAAVASSPGSAIPGAGLTPNGWTGAITVPTPKQRLDIARLAVDLLAEDSRTLELTFDGSNAVHSERAAAIASNAAQVGLTVELRPRSAASLANVLRKGDFEAALLAIDPTVAHAAELSRLWAFTGGFGGRWSATPGQVAYPIQITRPQEPALAAVGTARFEEAVRRGVWFVPIAIDPHRAGARAGVEGVQVGPEGSLALDRVWIGSPIR